VKKIGSAKNEKWGSADCEKNGWFLGVRNVKIGAKKKC